MTNDNEHGQKTSGIGGDGGISHVVGLVQGSAPVAKAAAEAASENAAGDNAAVGEETAWGETTELQRSATDWTAKNRTGSLSVLETEQPDAPFPITTMLREVSRKFGKPMTAVVSDMVRYNFGPGKVSPEDYFALRLFDDEALKGEDKSRFLTEPVLRKLIMTINGRCLSTGIVGDKIAFNSLLQTYGLPVIGHRAYFNASKNLPGLNFLSDANAIRAYLTNPDNLPVFGKPTLSALSLGTVAILSYDADADELTLGDGRRVPAEKLAAAIADNFADGYIFQDIVRPSAEVEAMCGPYLPTVRVVTLKDRDGFKVFRATWKIVGGSNMADNFWRKDNMLAAIDPTTGTIERVIRGKDVRQEELECHPLTGSRLLGEKVPGWEQIVETALWGARTFDDLAIIGWDLAPSDRGPLLVEANSYPDLRLVQYAQRSGVNTDAFKAFVDFHIGTRKEKRKESIRFAREQNRRVREKMIESLRKVS